MSDSFRLALCQLPPAGEKEPAVTGALESIKKAAEGGADIAVLPEMFDCPYSNRYFRDYSEREGGPTWQRLSAAAKENGIYLAAGSIPEYDDDKIYNTCFIFGPDGRQLAKHRKTHLFDINIEGGIKFQESKTLTAGDGITVFETPWGRIGVMICFDIRFAEFAMAYAARDIELLIVPAAFNMTTGPAHWERLMRARALDGQFYVGACGTARTDDPILHAYGNSMVTNPWGDVIACAGIKQGVLITEIDTAYTKDIRRQLPVLSARRPNMYK